ncbi:MAG: aminotransferase class V-fold PLP-dependent enzyme [Actinomycetales bacterium]|nr:aminotransferase class V-fold PLP-dependent enzyme [Actinomycetales bacterium]
MLLEAAGHAPWHPAAREAFSGLVDQGWADPRRLSAEGRRARLLLEAARESLAAGLGARTDEVRLTASHTQSLHAAVRGVVRGRRRSGATVLASAVERAAVLAAGRFAGELETVAVDAFGRVDAAAMAARLAGQGSTGQEAAGQGGVALAALQHANGEVGTVQPVEEVGAAARDAGVPLLVDAGSSLGHVPAPSTWDLLAANPGDWGGPSGVGVLAVRPRVRWSPDWPEDEDEWFPGGVSVPAAFAAAAALDAALADRRESEVRRRRQVARIRARVAAEVPDVDVVGDPEDRLPHVVTFSCLYVDGEALTSALDREGFAVASGSACTSGAEEPSHVLAAMGALTHGNVRLALHRSVTDEDVERFCDVLPGVVARVRDLLGAQGL